MNKKLIGGVAIAALVGLGAYFATSSSSSKQVVLAYGKGQSIDGEIASFNPAKADNTPTALGLHNEIAELMAFNKKGDLEPYAAKSVEASSDSKSVKVVLKDGLKYEDGTNVVSADYATGAKVLASDSTKSSYQSWATDWVKGAKEFSEGKSKEISGFKIKNDKEFTIELTKPVGFFKSTFASEMWAPVPQKFIDKIGGIDNFGKTEKEFISSGPLKIKSFKTGVGLELVKNDKTSLSKNIPVENVKFVPVKSFTSAAMQYKQNKLYSVEKTEISDKIIGKSKSDKANQVFSFAWMEYIVPNTEKVDKDMSKALYLALDKKYINDTFFYGSNKIRSVATPDTYKNVDAGLKKEGVKTSENEFDMEKAKKLVSSSKSKKDLTIIVKTEKNQIESFANYYKYALEQWKKIGVNVKVKELPTKVASEMMSKKAGKSRDYDLLFNSWSNDYPEASTFVYSLLDENSGNNWSNWKNAEFKKNLDKAMESSDESKSGESYAKALKIAKEEGALQPVFQYQANIYNAKEFNPYCIGGVLYVNYWK